MLTRASSRPNESSAVWTSRRLQRRGLADPDLDPRTAAAALVSMLSNFAYHWLAMGDAFDEELAKRTLTRLWAGAIGLR